MGQQNKKEAVSNLHKEIMMSSAERLFTEKGFSATTIEDISKASGYSRRTIYAYYESKEDLLYHIIEKGLKSLQGQIETALLQKNGFFDCYQKICASFQSYQTDYPVSMANVMNFRPNGSDMDQTPDVIKRIFSLGININSLLEQFLSNGHALGLLRKDINIKASVYIMWSNISSLLSLTETKGNIMEKELKMTSEEFLRYGFQQILNGLLEHAAD